MSVAAAVTTSDVVPGFGDQPLWLILIKVLGVFVFLVVMTLFSIVFERKVVGRMQNRIGPNRVGPWGILQSLADGVKLAFKEEIIPLLADKPVYFLAPILSAVPAFVAFSVIPFGPTVSIFGHHTAAAADRPAGRRAARLRLLVARGLRHRAVGLGVRLDLPAARWSALGRADDLLRGRDGPVDRGGLRLVRARCRPPASSPRQDHRWYVTSPLFISFCIYAIAIVGETNRAPFDLPEAESELVGGFHTEYSSFKFAMFFLAEYINMVTVSALATTLFLGGWHAPWGLHAIWSGCNSGWYPMIWFVIKVVIIIFVFVWLRGTLPRMRYDQFMHLGWKVLIPLNLVWIMLVSAVHVFRRPRLALVRDGVRHRYTRRGHRGVVGRSRPRVRVSVAKRTTLDDEEIEARLGPTFPTPPMNLVIPKTPKVARVTRARASLPRAQRRADRGPGRRR